MAAALVALVPAIPMIVDSIIKVFDGVEQRRKGTIGGRRPCKREWRRCDYTGDDSRRVDRGVQLAVDDAQRYAIQANEESYRQLAAATEARFAAEAARAEAQRAAAVERADKEVAMRKAEECKRQLAEAELAAEQARLRAVEAELQRKTVELQAFMARQAWKTATAEELLRMRELARSMLKVDSATWVVMGLGIMGLGKSSFCQDVAQHLGYPPEVVKEFAVSHALQCHTTPTVVPLTKHNMLLVDQPGGGSNDNPTAKMVDGYGILGCDLAIICIDPMVRQVDSEVNWEFFAAAHKLGQNMKTMVVIMKGDQIHEEHGVERAKTDLLNRLQTLGSDPGSDWHGWQLGLQDIFVWTTPNKATSGVLASERMRTLETVQSCVARARA